MYGALDLLSIPPHLTQLASARTTDPVHLVVRLELGLREKVTFVSGS